MKCNLSYPGTVRTWMSGAGSLCLILCLMLASPGGVFGLCRDYIKSAESGDIISQYKLASCYGAEGTDGAGLKAVFWYKKAALGGSTDAMLALGKYYFAVNEAESFKWYRKAAGHGSPEGAFEVGNGYYYGRGAKINRGYAFKWYESAASNGYSPAYLRLAQCYDNGRGTENNPSEAVKWYTKSAEEAGDAYAQYYLGSYYNYKKDRARAIKYYRMASENGNKKAAVRLAELNREEKPAPEPVASLSTSTWTFAGEDSAASASGREAVSDKNNTASNKKWWYIGGAVAAGVAVAAASGGSSGSSSGSVTEENSSDLGVQSGPGSAYSNDSAINVTASESQPYAVGVTAFGGGTAVNNGSITYGSASQSGTSSLESLGDSSFSQDDASVTGMYAVYGSTVSNAGSITLYSGDSTGMAASYGNIINASGATVTAYSSSEDAAGLSGDNSNVFNSGTVTAESAVSKAYGIEGSGSVYIRNDGDIEVTAAGQGYGISVDGDSSVVNTGTITVNAGEDAYGIYTEGNNNKVYNTGDINVTSSSGTAYGIYFDSGTGNKLYNSGNITLNGGASYSSNASNGDYIFGSSLESLDSQAVDDISSVTYENIFSRVSYTGDNISVTGDISAGDLSSAENETYLAAAVGENAVITNKAVISDTVGDDIIGMYALFGGSAVNEGTVNMITDEGAGMEAVYFSTVKNKADINGEGEFITGMNAYNNSSAENYGNITVSGSAPTGMHAEGSSSAVNYGVIVSSSADENNTAAGMEGGDAVFTNDSSGKIYVYSKQGSVGISSYGSGEINNYGEINAVSEQWASGIYGDDGSTVDNSGVVFSSAGIEAHGLEGYYSTVANSGRVDVYSGSTAYGINSYGSEVNNSGRITVNSSTGTVYGIYSGDTYGYSAESHIINNGLISAESDGGDAYGIYAEGTDSYPVYIVNNSTISAVSGSGTAYGIYAVNTVNVRNTGTINAESTDGDAYGIYFTGSGGKLYNSGNINSYSTNSVHEDIHGDYTPLCSADEIYVNGECKTMSEMGSEYSGNTPGLYYFGYKQSGDSFTLSTATSNSAETVNYSAYVTGYMHEALLMAFGLSGSTVTNTIEIDAQSPYVNGDGAAVMFSSGSAYAVNTGTISVTGSDYFYKGMRTKGGYIINSGLISMSGSYTSSAGEEGRNNLRAMKVNEGGTAVNTGSIIVSLNSGDSSYGAEVSGIDADYGYIVNTGTISVSANVYKWAGAAFDENSYHIAGVGSDSGGESKNYGTINVSAAFSNGATGAVAGLTGDSDIENYGTVTVNSSGGFVAGIAAFDDATIINAGTINVTNTNGDAYGVYVTAGATVSLYNTGTISVTATNGTAYGIYLQDGDSSSEKTSLSLYNSGTFTLTDDGVTINTDGTGSDIAASTNNYVMPEGSNTSVSGLDSNPYASLGSSVSSTESFSLSGLDLDSIGAAVYVMQGGSYTSDQSVYGSLGVAASVTQGSNDDSYTVEGAVKAGEDIDVDVYSESVMFDASLDVTSDSSGEYNEIGNASLTRRSFSSLTSNSSLASFLEKNYEAGNIVSSFDELKSADTLEGFTESLGNITDSVILPNFTRQNFNTAKRINRTFHDEMFNGEKNTVGFVSGYDSRNARSGIEGYSDSFYDVYAMFDKGNPGVFGLSVAKLSSSYDDDSERDVTYFFLHKPFMFELGETSLLVTPTAGYSNGDYTRKEDGVSSSADISAWHYGITNEARYKAELGFADLEPSAELNLQGYYQNRLEEGNGAEVKAQNFLNAEGGLGLYLSRVFSLGSNQGLNIRGGGTYYYATNNHRQKATISGAEGYYKMESSDTDNGSGVINLTAEYRINDIRLHGELYERLGRDSIFNWNAGISYMF